MTSHFILDENVIELAARGENDKGQSDFTCLALMLGILKKCDIVHSSAELLEIYREKLKIMEENMIRSASLTAKLIKHMINQGKLSVEDNPPPLQDESDLPKDDIFIVRLAASHTNSTLVSTDSPLKDKIRIKKLSIRIVHPSEIEID